MVGFCSGNFTHTQLIPHQFNSKYTGQCLANSKCRLRCSSCQYYPPLHIGVSSSCSHPSMQETKTWCLCIRPCAHWIQTRLKTLPIMGPKNQTHDFIVGRDVRWGVLPTSTHVIHLWCRKIDSFKWIIDFLFSSIILEIKATGSYTKTLSYCNSQRELFILHSQAGSIHFSGSSRRSMMKQNLTMNTPPPPTRGWKTWKVLLLVSKLYVCNGSQPRVHQIYEGSPNHRGKPAGNTRVKDVLSCHIWKSNMGYSGIKAFQRTIKKKTQDFYFEWNQEGRWRMTRNETGRMIMYESSSNLTEMRGWFGKGDVGRWRNVCLCSNQTRGDVWCHLKFSHI